MSEQMVEFGMVVRCGSMTWKARLVWWAPREKICFFQAEDGKRDLVRSRGLGDVYKRQLGAYADEVHDGRQNVRLANHSVPRSPTGHARRGSDDQRHANHEVVQRNDVPLLDILLVGAGPPTPVSSTHLTLPTIYPVSISVFAVSLKKTTTHITHSS